MRYFRFSLLIVLLTGLLVTGCGYSDGDVLASYQDGAKTVNVTRGEFYASLNRWVKQRVLANRQSQERSLRGFVFEQLKVLEADKAGLGNTEAFKKALKESVNKRLALSSYLKEKHPQFLSFTKDRKIELKPFSFKVSIVSHLVVRVSEYKTVQEPDPNRFKKMQQARVSVKDPKKLALRLKQLANAKVSKRVKLSPAELADAEKKALDRVKKAEAELKSGKSFPAVARAYGQDGTARKGGHFGFVYPFQQRLDIPFREAALKLKSGETSGIVKGQFGYHLIKCDRIVTLTDSNIKDYYPTPEQKKSDERRIAAMKKRLDQLKGKQKEQYEKRIESTEKRLASTYERQMGQALRGFWFSSVMQYMANLKKTDSNIKINEDALKGNDREAVVFEINHPEFTFKLKLGEYLDLMSKVHPRRLSQWGIKRGLNDKRPFTYEERRSYLNWHVTFSLLTYSAYKSGVVKMDFFRKKVADLRGKELAKAIQDKITASVKTTDKELLDEYNKNKARYVSRKRVRGAGGKWTTKTQQLTFVEAKERVKQALEGQRKRNIILGWQSRLFQKYKIRIFPDRFEIVKPKARPKRPARRPMMRRRRPPMQKKNR